MSKKITVVGSFVTDMVVTMEKFAKDGETVIGKSLRTYLGGKGANQCIAAKRLGGDADMVGMLGADENGDKFRKLFLSEGIGCNNIFTDLSEPTAVAQVQINKSYQNRICVIPGANYSFSIEHLNAANKDIKRSSIILTQLELNHNVTFKLIEMCDCYGVPIILNPAPAIKIENQILSKVSYLTPNETELSILTGLETGSIKQIETACKKLFCSGVKCIVSTLGSKGAYVYDSMGGRLILGYKVKAVDTVAAGDSFNGALSVALIEGKSIDDAVNFANAMGALTVTEKGAIPSIHNRSQLDEFINTNNIR